MDTFRGRLWFVAKKVLSSLGLFICILAVFVAFVYVSVKIEWIETAMAWTIGIFFGLMGLCAVVLIIMHIINGLRWLFVGPQKKEKDIND